MKFSLRTVLTVTTGRLLTKRKSENDNGIGDLYKILNHMNGDKVHDSQLGRFCDECTPVLLDRFPELEKTDISKLDDLMEIAETQSAIDLWIKWCIAESMKEEYDVEPMEPHLHKHMNPIKEYLHTLLGVNDN